MIRSLIPAIALLAIVARADSSPCIGDCDYSGDVTVNEVETLILIALGELPMSACDNGIIADRQVDITEIIWAVNSALNACPSN